MKSRNIRKKHQRRKTRKGGGWFSSALPVPFCDCKKEKDSIYDLSEIRDGLLENLDNLNKRLNRLAPPENSEFHELEDPDASEEFYDTHDTLEDEVSTGSPVRPQVVSQAAAQDSPPSQVSSVRPDGPDITTIRQEERKINSVVIHTVQNANLFSMPGINVKVQQFNPDDHTTPYNIKSKYVGPLRFGIKGAKTWGSLVKLGNQNTLNDENIQAGYGYDIDKIHKFGRYVLSTGLFILNLPTNVTNIDISGFLNDNNTVYIFDLEPFIQYLEQRRKQFDSINFKFANLNTSQIQRLKRITKELIYSLYELRGNDVLCYTFTTTSTMGGKRNKKTRRKGGFWFKTSSPLTDKWKVIRFPSGQVIAIREKSGNLQAGVVRDKNVYDIENHTPSSEYYKILKQHYCCENDVGQMNILIQEIEYLKKEIKNIEAEIAKELPI